MGVVTESDKESNRNHINREYLHLLLYLFYLWVRYSTDTGVGKTPCHTTCQELVRNWVGTDKELVQDFKDLNKLMVLDTLSDSVSEAVTGLIKHWNKTFKELVQGWHGVSIRTLSDSVSVLVQRLEQNTNKPQQHHYP